MDSRNSGYRKYLYSDANYNQSHQYLLPAVDRALANFGPARVFDLGCGNGSVANHLAASYEVAGVDASETGIRQAKINYPALRLELASVYDDLVTRYGQYDAIVSLEVVEHLYDPRLFARRMFDLLRPGGNVVISTPYHGYFKNLALAVTGKLDAHFTALWDGGHIKFWSVRTLTKLLSEAGFVDIRFQFVGRIPALAKSMIATAEKPAA